MNMPKLECTNKSFMSDFQNFDATYIKCLTVSCYAILLLLLVIVTNKRVEVNIVKFLQFNCDI